MMHGTAFSEDLKPIIFFPPKHGQFKKYSAKLISMPLKFMFPCAYGYDQVCVQYSSIKKYVRRGFRPYRI